MILILLLLGISLVQAGFNTMQVKKNINMDIATRCIWRRIQQIDLTDQKKVSIGYEYTYQTSKTIDVTKFAEEVKSQLKSSQNTHGWQVSASLTTSASFIASVEISVAAGAHGEYTNSEQTNNELKNSITNHKSETGTKSWTIKIDVREGGMTNVWQLHCSGPGFWENSKIVVQPDPPDAFNISTQYDVTLLIDKEIPLINYKWDFVECGKGICIYDLMAPQVKFINDTHYELTAPLENIIELSTNFMGFNLSGRISNDCLQSTDDTSVLMKVGKWSINEEDGDLVARDVSNNPEQSLFTGKNYGKYFIFGPNVQVDIGKYRYPTDEERNQNLVLVQGKRWQIAIEQGTLVFRDTKCCQRAKDKGRDCRYKIHRKTDFRFDDSKY